MLIWPKKVLGCQQTESGFYLGYKWQGKAIQTKARQNKGWVKATKERQIKKKYKPRANHRFVEPYSKKNNSNLIPLKGKPVNSMD